MKPKKTGATSPPYLLDTTFLMHRKGDFAQFRATRGQDEHRQFNTGDATPAGGCGGSFDRERLSHQSEDASDDGVKGRRAAVPVVGPHPALHVGSLLGLGERPPEWAAEQHVRSRCNRPAAPARPRP